MGSGWRRLRSWLSLSRPLIVLGAVLLISIAGGTAVVAVGVWGFEWIGNLASAVAVTFATALIVDFTIVRRRRHAAGKEIERARGVVAVACAELAEKSRSFASDIADSISHGGLWIPATSFPATAVAEQLGFWRSRVRESLVGMTLETGTGFARTRTDTLDDRLASFVAAYDAAYRANKAVSQSMEPPPFSFEDILALRADPEPDADLLVEAERARHAGQAAHDDLVEHLSEILRMNASFPIRLYVASRIPSRLPPWLRAAAGTVSVLWALVLLSGVRTPLPPPFPPTFLSDNVSNLIADGLVAIFAAAAVLALSERNRIGLLGRAHESARLIGLTNFALTNMAISATPELRGELGPSASRLEDLVDALMHESPDAELALRGRRVVTGLRQLASSHGPLWLSAADQVDRSFRVNGWTEGYLGALGQQERAKADTTARFPIPALHDLIVDMSALSDIAFAVARNER